MGFAATDIVFFNAQNNYDGDGNGGAIGSSQIASSSANDIFPDVDPDDLASGKTRFRKVFMKNQNTAGLTLYSGEVYVHTQSLADDHFLLKAGTDSDVQSAVSGESNWAGTGALNAATTISGTTIAIDFDSPQGVYDGAKILIFDGTSTYKRTVSGDVSWVGNTATVTVTSQVGKVFSTANTKVATVVELGHLTPSSANWTESGSGTYDESAYPLTLYNIGTKTDSWTLTFTSATAFSVSGAASGVVGSGTVSSDFKPANGGSYYFMLDADGWGGSWTLGDTITFDTVHAAKGFWMQEVVPAGISSYSNNVVRLGWRGSAGS